MRPAHLSLVDQARATAKEALGTPCQCGECPSDDDLRALIAMTDEEVLAVLYQMGQA